MKKAAEITGVEAEVSRRVYLRHSRVQEPKSHGHTRPPNTLTNRSYFPTFVMSHLAQRYRNGGENLLPSKTDLSVTQPSGSAERLSKDCQKRHLRLERGTGRHAIKVRHQRQLELWGLN